MHINPLLMSIAAPAAAKTVRAVVHVAQNVGQGFLKTLHNLGEEPLSPVEAAPAGIAGELHNFANRFRNWLGENGVQSPFELKFNVDAAGGQIANVVGKDSERIVDLLYSSSDWQEQLTRLAQRAQAQAIDSSFSTVSPVKIAISSEDEWIQKYAADGSSIRHHW